MNASVTPKVFISYTWIDDKDITGARVRVPDKRALDLAERLRSAGFDSRLDVYFKDSHYGFTPPQRVPSDGRDPWIIWAEQQIRDADCVLLMCTPEYTASDPNLGECPGQWCDWHYLDEKLKFEKRVPFLWWDWHFIAKDLESQTAEPQKFIPVGFGPYNPRHIPGFVRGATYCNIDSPSDFDGLFRRIRSEYRRKHPRRGVFVSYSHKDKKWLEKFQTMLKPVMPSDMLWDDTRITIGSKWRDEIRTSLASAKVALLLVSDKFLASDFIQKDELPPLLRAANDDGLLIFWVPVGFSMYEATPIAEYQAASDPSRPLSSLNGPSRDKAIVEICKQIKAAAEKT